MRRISWFGLLLAFVTLIAACSNATSPQSLSGAASGSQRSITDEFGDTYLLPYSPYDYEVLLAKFAPATAGDSNIFLVDGKLNPAVWDGAAAAQVDNFKNASGAATATSGVSGTLKAVWDGYTLYLAVTAGDNTVSKNNTIENNTSRIVNFTDTNNWTNFDGVEFDIDFLNEKTHRGDNNILGKVKVTRGGKLVGTRLSGSNGQAAIFGDPYTNVDHQEFTDRLKSWGAYEAGQGYVAWLAVEIYAGADPANGMAFGFDVIIQDSPADSQAVTQKTYWSHNDNSYYTDSSSNMSMTLDWGTIVLSGHTGDTSNFAYSDWMLTNPIRWAKGDPWWPPTTPTNFSYLINLPDAVADSWEPTSWTAFQNAITAGKAKLTQADSWGRPHINFAVTSQAEVKTLAQAVEAGIVNLRWADDLLGATELDAAPLNTLSDPLRFKTNGDITPNETIPGLTGRKGTLVASAADWALRVREIKALAALYEYGPIPDAPASHSVVIQSTPRVPAHWEHPGWWIVGGLPSKVDETPGAYSLTATYTYNGTESASWDGTAETKIAGLNAQPGTMTDAYTFSFPSEADKAANGVTGAVPVVLSFSGSTQAYLTRGIAIVNVPTTVTTDDRQNAWRGRDGTFRAFYPYSRGMRYEISNEMAAAWGSSRAADALYDAAEMDIIETPITIANVVSSSDFQLGDRLSADGVTWWTVGQITGAETPDGQLGTGGIIMLYLASGAVPPTSGGSVTFTQFQRMEGNGVYAVAARGNASAVITVGTPTSIGKKMKDVVDHTKLATDGFSINGKYAFVSQVFDDRINVGIPGAAGATGPQPWRYDPKGNEYSWESLSGYPGGGAELPADNVLKNPGRLNEVFRRFLSHFRYYEHLKGIDVNGDISHGFAERLPFDNHELTASLYPRAIVERNTFNDYNDGSESDAISLQAARIVYRYLIDKGFGEHKTPVGTVASSEDLIKFNYRATGGHGSDPIQAEREAQYMAWYFYGKTMSTAFASHLNIDPFYNDVLVPGGSNSYERHYGGFTTMMPWSWAGPYYPK